MSLLTSGIKVRKRFELRGFDEQDFQQRMEIFQQAVQARGGVILEIRRAGRGADSEYCAWVFYQVPLANVQVELPTGDTLELPCSE